MAYTVKQVAEMSGVSVRTLRFYDSTSLLKPAYHGKNRYRFYEEPQLLRLQQILFYRELGFELKKIKRILGRSDFEVAAALQSHREALRTELARKHTLLHTIDNTIRHLKGEKKMKGEEMFAGFRVPAGDDRFGEHLKLDGQPVDCKLSARDTDGAMCVFEFSFGWPRHRHRDQDEWIYVIEGEVDFEVGERRFRVGSGESVFIPRQVAHGLSTAAGEPAKIINVFRPAGKMEEFFRELSNVTDLPTREQALGGTVSEKQIETLWRLFDAHGMDLLGPGD